MFRVSFKMLSLIFSMRAIIKKYGL